MVGLAGSSAETLWEGTGDDASASIVDDAIEISLVTSTSDEPFFGGGDQPSTERELRLVWRRNKLVERPAD